MKYRFIQGVTFYVFVIVLIIHFSSINSFLYSENEEETFYRNKKNYDVRKPSKEHSDNSLKITSSRRSTIFATENSSVVYAQIGGTATLPCIIRKFNNGVVSWIRKQDSPALLTVGLTTYSADERFFVEHVRHLQNWGLLIKHVQTSDAGQYECQISTHPPTSIFIELKVTEAVAEILGSPDVHLRVGSLLRLVCTLRDSTEPPSYVFWYHNQRMINYDVGITVLPDTSSSVLLLQEADQRHSGNYTCSPSNAVPASINVHVLNATEEEIPAAMLDTNSGNASNLDIQLFITILCINLFIVPTVER